MLSSRFFAFGILLAFFLQSTAGGGTLSAFAPLVVPHVHAQVYAGEATYSKWLNYYPYNGTWETRNNAPVAFLLGINASSVSVFNNTDHYFPLEISSYKVFTDGHWEQYDFRSYKVNAHSSWQPLAISVPSCGYVISVGYKGHTPISGLPPPDGKVGIAKFINVGACPVPPPPPLNNALCTLLNAPDEVLVDQSFPIAVTMVNNGNTTWTKAPAYASNGYKLGTQAPQDNRVFGQSRFSLPADIPPSANVNISFLAQAPAAPGEYTLKYQMVQEGSQWFGQKCSKQIIVRAPIVTTSAPQNNAQCGALTLPSSVKPGQTIPMTVSFQNNGTTTWDPSAYKLGTQDPQDNTVFGVYRVAVPHSVAPGGSATFSLTGTVPMIPGTYTVSYQMLQENVEWFGQKCIAIVTVKDTAVCKGIIAPDFVTPGESFPVTFQILNDGVATVWNAVATDSPVGFKLVSAEPLRNDVFQVAQQGLSSDVPSGATASITFTARAPLTYGNYSLGYQMFREGYGAFGSVCKKTVSVKPSRNPLLIASPDDITALGLWDNTLYVGGNFSSLGGVPRQNMAAVDATLGNIQSWNPNMNAGGPRTIATNGSIVYVGGNFTTINGALRRGAAAYNTDDGTLTNWNPDVGSDGIVYSLATDGSLVYLGGSFSKIGTQPRYNIGAVDSAYGVPSPFNPPSVNGTVRTVVTDGTSVYVGGDFTSVGGQNTPSAATRNYVAAFSAATSALLAWNPNANGSVTTLLINGATLYLSGLYSQIGNQSRGVAAVNNTDGSLLGWNPQVIVPAMAIGASTMYMGGAFTSVAGQVRAYLAAVDLFGTLVSGWNPGANGQVRSVSLNGSVVYAGGDFTSAAGGSHNQLVAIRSDGSSVPGFHPDIGDVGRYVYAVDATLDRHLFVGDNLHLYWYTY